jgi:hypothetical protein
VRKVAAIAKAAALGGQKPAHDAKVPSGCAANHGSAYAPPRAQQARVDARSGSSLARLVHSTVLALSVVPRKTMMATRRRCAHAMRGPG